MRASSRAASVAGRTARLWDWRRRSDMTDLDIDTDQGADVDSGMDSDGPEDEPKDEPTEEDEA